MPSEIEAEQVFFGSLISTQRRKDAKAQKDAPRLCVFASLRLKKSSLKKQLATLLFTASFLPLTLSAFEAEPWFGDVYEFEFNSSYTYSFFNHVQNGEPALKSFFHSQLLNLGISVPFSESWEAAIESEFVDTTQQSYGFRSLAAQVRYLFLDDVGGDDLISLAGGINTRWAYSHALSDISCPYHSYFNIEGTLTAGKEWDFGEYWRHRTYALIGLGTGNQGYPWTRLLLSYEINSCDKHRGNLFLENYVGYGPQNKVFIHDFHSYARIAHRSIDIGAGYEYLLDYWGSFLFEVAFRPYAHSYPEYVTFFTVAYRLPFSLF